ncbi:MAG TPA: hypothetical protein VMV92_20850 [Streptosporangiaceae bacterium]|nr:hypothetical protein [Streptosporangiaceae bacterium]
MDIPILLANSIVQSAGGDLYKQCRKILGQNFERLGFRQKAVADLDATAKRLRKNPEVRAAEVDRWIYQLKRLLDSNPSAETELNGVYEELVHLLSKPATSQIGFAGRDQYNIGGDATFPGR